MVVVQNSPSRENRVFAALARDDLQRLIAHASRRVLPVGHVLFEPEDVVHYAHFPLSGAIATQVILEDGATIEVGLFGSSGMVGISACLGARTVPYRAIVQLECEAFAVPISVLRREFATCESVRRVLARYASAIIGSAAQAIACNRHHTLEERLCRWLLRLHDLGGADEIPLKQEYLAAMIGSRRPSVSSAAALLQDAGAIQYRRGRIVVLDRPALEMRACECYALVKCLTESAFAS